MSRTSELSFAHQAKRQDAERRIEALQAGARTAEATAAARASQAARERSERDALLRSELQHSSVAQTELRRAREAQVGPRALA